MNRKIDVLFILPSLRSGGAERVMSFLAQNLNPDKFNSQLLVTGSDKDQKYKVENIPVTFLNKDRVKHSVLGIVKHLRECDPDVVISAMGHVNTITGLLGLIFPRIKFVARETTMYSFNMENEVAPQKGRIMLYQLALKSLDKIICQSNDMKNDMLRHCDVGMDKIVVINNPVTSKFKLKHRDFGEDGTYRFISIGRLTEKKGFQRVLRALVNFDSPFHYTIIGSGEYRDVLVNLVAELGLTAKITFVPYTDKINDYLGDSDLYLQGSYVEGFPNALLESCATGTPAVVFNAPGGINEIIVEGQNGYIAEDINDFSEKVKLSVCQNWNPEFIRQSVYDRYSEQIILSKYESLFLDLIN